MALAPVIFAIIVTLIAETAAGAWAYPRSQCPGFMRQPSPCRTH
jgi:hypothetical protein